MLLCMGFASSVVRLNYPSAATAQIARTTLEVDLELQPQRISKTFEVDSNQLTVYAHMPLPSWLVGWFVWLTNRL